MLERYHIDLSEPGLLDRKSSRWLQSCIAGLLSIPRSEFALGSRLQMALYPPKQKGGE